MNVQQRIRPAGLPGDGPAHSIAGIFAAELQVPSIGLDDNFFDLGGDSLNERQHRGPVGAPRVIRRSETRGNARSLHPRR
ncbi:phosphopantetheine-binding protein [Mesorhizobium sp. B2-4-15]|uniref:phosphopantetheine-binding protein n=1 Tax=Mesorhizobium sp. B2-4-15 TaxID=2589934 RepID=UPI001FEDEAF7|nr:phosphopantetheine-binding protein [Mesorhizobium sp. B2-4-15]